MKTRWIKYFVHEQTIESARVLADELRESGRYVGVRVRKTGAGFAGDGEWHEFARVYVSEVVAA